MSFLYITKVSNEIEEKEDQGRKSIQNKMKKINQMKYSLILYPVVSGIIWIFYFILQIFVNEANKNENINISLRNSMRNGFGSWVLTILISFRQFIFAFLFFWTQVSLKKYAYNLITCQKNKKNTITNENKSE